MSDASPTSRIFLSCDLTGSTAFKQRDDHHAQAPWQKAFLQFYREFPQTIRMTQAEERFAEASDLEFVLWKPVGDELIFTCDLKSEADVYWAVHIWLEAMQRYQQESLTDERLKINGGPKLGVKGGAFIATFPGPDSESSIPRNPSDEASGNDVILENKKALSGRRSHSKYLYDFFGPSIDTGFRVVAQCDSRFFTLSVEVAFVLSVHATAATRKKHPLAHPLVLRRGHELKGVWGGRSYPIFALDLEGSSAVNAAYAKFEPPRDDLENIKDLCHACYTSPGWPFQVYLPNSSTHGHFSDIPVDPMKSYVPEIAQEATPKDATAGKPVQDDAPMS